MPIDQSSVKSDLTLEIDEKSVSVIDFLRAAENFIGLVREVAEAAAPDRDSSTWLVDVYPGSVGIGVRAQGGAYSEAQVVAIRAEVINGLRDLNSSGRNAMFSDKAVSYSKNLGLLLARKKGSSIIRVLGGRGSGESVDLSKATVKGADRILSPQYSQAGSVEGVIRTVSEARNRNEFVVYDTVNENGISCYVVDHLLMKQAMNAFRTRVEVYGEVQYRADGQPVSINAKKIIPFPLESELPGLAEFRELLRGV